MALAEKKTPYEFLARWDRDGKLVAAHVAFRTIIERDGQFLSENMEPALPVSLAGKSGFPIEDLLGEVHVSALAKAETLQDELTASNAQIAQLTKALETALSEKNELATKLSGVGKALGVEIT